ACGHLAEWLRFGLDGYPKLPWPVRLVCRALQPLIGRRLLRRVLARRAMPTGWRTLRESVFPPGADAAGVERLRRAHERFNAHVGRFHLSPLIGELDREEWLQLHLIHCSHHLSFLLPKIERRTS